MTPRRARRRKGAIACAATRRKRSRRLIQLAAPAGLQLVGPPADLDNAALRTIGGSGPLPIRCDLKHAHGIGYCLYRCPIASSRRAFEVLAVDPRRGLPLAERGAIDVVALDMNKGWPNIGFDAILFALRDAVCDFAPLIEGKDVR